MSTVEGQIYNRAQLQLRPPLQPFSSRKVCPKGQLLLIIFLNSRFLTIMLEFLHPGRKWAKISETIDDRENMMSGPPGPKTKRGGDKDSDGMLQRKFSLVEKNWKRKIPMLIAS